MLVLNLTFTPFDMSLCYSQTRNFYKWGWAGYSKKDLRNQVKTGLLPAAEYKKITGDDYEEPAKSAK
ncbi:XkdX family protein [uncultured Lactobacillus sp.]|uniref:XkdX family protein n=1 Tax=uncultured Lactobacillus sp. TaxID=153152 RepID=UPI002619211F|nr:XkdX family protein [uncultured Lactobacillus sp.]